MRNGLVKTEAIVLSKFKYSDSSNIVNFYTRKRGRISAMIKGGRSLKSKSGLATDVLNIVELFYYEKEGRDLYTVNTSELVFYPRQVITDINALYCATSVAELLKELTPEHEENDRLYRGSEKIIKLMDSNIGDAQTLFLKYFLFFLEESGVGIHSESCSSCGSLIVNSEQVRFDSGNGILCAKCGFDKRRGINISMELYRLLFSLNKGLPIEVFDKKTVSDLFLLLETYTRTHFETFKGLKAFRLIGGI